MSPKIFLSAFYRGTPNAGIGLELNRCTRLLHITEWVFPEAQQQGSLP